MGGNLGERFERGKRAGATGPGGDSRNEGDGVTLADQFHKTCIVHAPSPKKHKGGIPGTHNVGATSVGISFCCSELCNPAESFLPPPPTASPAAARGPRCTDPTPPSFEARVLNLGQPARRAFDISRHGHRLDTDTDTDTALCDTDTAARPRAGGKDGEGRELAGRGSPRPTACIRNGERDRQRRAGSPESLATDSRPYAGKAAAAGSFVVVFACLTLLDMAHGLAVLDHLHHVLRH